MINITIPDICRNNHGGNENSEAANRKINPHKTSIKLKILEFLTRKPCTCQEIEKALQLTHQCCSARIAELKAKNYVTVSGNQLNANNYPVSVYSVSAEQLQAYKEGRPCVK